MFSSYILSYFLILHLLEHKVGNNANIANICVFLTRLSNIINNVIKLNKCGVVNDIIDYINNQVSFKSFLHMSRAINSASKYTGAEPELLLGGMPIPGGSACPIF